MAPAPEVELRPTPAQWEVLNSPARITIYIAGTGTGKTYIGRYWLAQQVHRRGQRNPVTGEPAKALVMSPSYPSYAANMLSGAIPWMTDTLRWGSYNKADRMLQLRLEVGGGQVFFRSAEAALSAEGIHAAIGVWIDEPGQVDQAAWEVALRRASLAGSPILLTGYPLTGGGWYRDLYDRGVAGDPDIAIVRGRTEDSPFYDKAALELARKTLPSWRFAQIYEGQFTRAMGAIYPQARVEPLPADVRSRLQRYGGADYGWTATAAVHLGWDGPTCWVLGAYKAGERENDQHAEAFRAIGLAEPGVVAIYGDPAAKQSWPDFRRHGLAIRPATGGPGSVLAGITRIIGLVNGGDLRFASDAPGLSALLAEWDAYRWHTDGDGRVVREEPVKEADHILDALRYAITNSRPAGREAGIAIGAGWR